METEVDVFQKCLSCSTFITSPFSTVIRKHVYKCRLKKGGNSSTVRNPPENDSDCDDFIDDEVETVIFPQPCLVLKRCKLKRSNFKDIKLEENSESEDETWDTKPNIGKKNVPGSGQFIATRRKSKRRQRCEKCCTLIDPRYLENHIKNCHSKAVPEEQRGTLKCAYPDCEMKCKTLRLLKCHFTLHLEKNPYICNFPGCKVKCDMAAHLHRHIRLQHLSALISCPTCGVSYASRESLKFHGCESNLQKLHSGKYLLLQDEDSGWRLKRVVMLETESVIKCEQTRQSSPVVPIGSTAAYLDKVEEYIKYLKSIDIDAIIRSDPGFIQACKDSPGFSELLLGERLHLILGNRQ